MPDQHVLAVLMDEHQRLLAHLGRLETIAQEGEANPGNARSAELLREVQTIAAALIGAEPHHRREEEVLFPALEERGVHGPPQVMAHEHVELRALKHSLQDCAGRVLSGRAGWPELARTARTLVGRLRDHIAKEDEVLYPLAFRAIPEPAVWDELKRRCDAIGYCCSAHG